MYNNPILDASGKAKKEDLDRIEQKLCKNPCGGARALSDV